MQVVYYEDQAPDHLYKSVFLAGPSPRSSDVASWRPEALALLERLGYDGVVFVPEWRKGKPEATRRSLQILQYEQTIDWEDRHLNMADVIMFWIPRDMKTLPGLTTNIEFGRWENSGKIILGHPGDAPHCSYLDHYARAEGVTVCTELEDTVLATIQRLGKGASRTGGERCVPLHIWLRPEFQDWYQTQTKAENRLDDAKMVWTFRVGKNKERYFMWAIHVKVWIAAEGRYKTNEVIVQRPDVFGVVAWYPAANVLDTEILLVKEFRSPANTDDGYIHELPGGSVKGNDLESGAKAVEELEEETGLAIPTERLRVLAARQLYGTLLTHKAHVFSVALTDQERLTIDWLSEMPHGVVEDTERTYVEIRTLRDILEKNDVDWANVGMILSAVTSTGGYNVSP